MQKEHYTLCKQSQKTKNVAIVEGHNSLEWLAWHLVGVAGAFGHFAGLQIPAPGPDMPIPGKWQKLWKCMKL